MEWSRLAISVGLPVTIILSFEELIRLFVARLLFRRWKRNDKEQKNNHGNDEQNEWHGNIQWHILPMP